MTAPSNGEGRAPARLLGLRLQGFKSFAERTVVEFGPGISAVVGPNGSGKSNLADALRWALGEQGRALRSRRSEDVIFAGSERRSALGMADVTLVLDNADALLPVDFSVLEIGRRLYRSGENDYLLNKQRIRLRDLVDLLDAAHLADNAFLFIGQGMVDQALALRPEERRPLFEEVAGVRRHERRRRRAEEQLVEAEANLARVEDILAELRPQARRLAAQAEQQTSRTSAGEELAAALLLTGHARWHDVASRASAASGRLSAARADMDTALSGLQDAERVATAITADLAARSALELERRGSHEASRDALVDGRLRQARLAADVEAISRDRRRLEEERALAETAVAVNRREIAAPIPERDADLESELAARERSLAEALHELEALRARDAALGDELAALRRAETARRVEGETARRQLADAERRLGEEAARAREISVRRAELDRAAREAAATLESAVAAELGAAGARVAARTTLDESEGRRLSASERAGAAGARAAALRGRLDALTARLADEETRGIARAARRRGGRRLDEGLTVAPEFRAAVEAALGEAARAYLVDEAAVAELAAERGILVIERPDAEAGAPTSPVPGALRERLAAAGGGLLSDALRRDPTGAGRRLLGTAAWVPDIAAILEIQPHLPPGWVLVVRDGSAVAGNVTVTLGRPDALLERRAEVDRLAVDVASAAAEAETAVGEAAKVAREAVRARDALDAALALEAAATSSRRRAEEADRAAGRADEAVAREEAWHAAQVLRLEAEVARTREAVARLESAATDRSGSVDAAAAGSETAPAIAAWQERVAKSRQERDRTALVLDELARSRRDGEARRARAEAATALAEDGIARAARDLATLGERERNLGSEGERLATELAAATAREAHARHLLDELRAADALDRDRLAAAETGAAAARERLRVAEDRLRSAEVADLEARLGLDAIREQILVEIAGLGELGLRSLGVFGLIDDESAAIEAALAAQAVDWAASAPTDEPPPAGRLAYLRRRYHELGAANPFAVEEYSALKVRLDALETQHADLTSAIGRTRALIEELSALIADQFQATFRALETAFDARFQQLFGGGFARLSLTDPADLSATGVEIVARPPGKKAQALAMLSGGERALTAVALLFAMLEVRPVPFCVLDEVDAALDEANVGRFSDALRGLAHQTQFIVITHNRGTIEIADALYGVTAGDDSVSRVISLRLEEAREIAQRRAAETTAVPAVEAPAVGAGDPADRLAG